MLLETLAVDWRQIHLLEAHLAQWRLKAGWRRREFLKYKITGDRAHHWKEVNEARHNQKATKADERQILQSREKMHKWASLLGEAHRETHRLEVAIQKLKPKQQLWLAGGFVKPNSAFRMQRKDQGQDFEILLGHAICAPGDGYCMEYSHDRPFPNGFGDPYAVIKVNTGRFAAMDEIYCGHDNIPIIKPDEHFVAGQPIAIADHYLNSGWGWSEVGHWPPGSMNEGWRWAHLFTPVLR